MAEHPNVALMRSAYQALGRGDLAAVGEGLADDVVHHFPGRSPLAGDQRGKEALFGFWGRQFELCGGTLRVVPSHILADDEYCVALVHVSAERAGRRPLAAPGVNVGRIRDGRTVEMWSYTADQHAVDEFWS